MSKRLQVVLDDAEYRELQRLSRKQGMTLSQWVRRAIAAMKRREPEADVGRKLMAIREAAKHAYPTADIEQMLAETERGYLVGLGDNDNER